jgi:chromosome segregation ATPase
MKNSQYKSPAHKLISFFKNSRESLQTKAQDASSQIRSLTEMHRALRQRRDELQAEVKELRQQVKYLDKQLLPFANSPKNDIQKKRAAIIIEQNSAGADSRNTKSQADTSLVPANLNSDASVISMASELVTIACSSFRSAGKSFDVIEKYLPIDTPSADS